MSFSVLAICGGGGGGCGGGRMRCDDTATQRNTPHAHLRGPTSASQLHGRVGVGLGCVAASSCVCTAYGYRCTHRLGLARARASPPHTSGAAGWVAVWVGGWAGGADSSRHRQQQAPYLILDGHGDERGGDDVGLRRQPLGHHDAGQRHPAACRRRRVWPLVALVAVGDLTLDDRVNVLLLNGARVEVGEPAAAR